MAFDEAGVFVVDGNGALQHGDPARAESVFSIVYETADHRYEVQKPSTFWQAVARASSP